MTDATPLPFDLPSVRRKKLTVDFDGGNQSSNAGLLLLGQAERKFGVCRRLADAMPDRRDASRIRHEMFSISCSIRTMSAQMIEAELQRRKTEGGSQ